MFRPSSGEPAQNAGWVLLGLVSAGRPENSLSPFGSHLPVRSALGAPHRGAAPRGAVFLHYFAGFAGFKVVGLRSRLPARSVLNGRHRRPAPYAPLLACRLGPSLGSVPLARNDPLKRLAKLLRTSRCFFDVREGQRRGRAPSPCTGAAFSRRPDARLGSSVTLVTQF